MSYSLVSHCCWLKLIDPSLLTTIGQLLISQFPRNRELAGPGHEASVRLRVKTRRGSTRERSPPHHVVTERSVSTRFSERKIVYGVPC